MTPKAQQTAIAKACGWTETVCEVERDNAGYQWTETVSVWRDSSGAERNLPNYPSDLNACHEIEKVLTDVQRRHFAGWLEAIASSAVSVGTLDQNGETDYFQLFKCAHATAAQRCEAFLRTLNLWTDG